MATASLVDLDVQSGLTLLKILDEADFGVEAALWLYNGELEKWDLVVAAEDAGRELSRKSLEAAVIIAEWRKRHPEEAVLDLARVRLVGTDDRLIAGLKPIVQVRGLDGVRLSNRLVNGIYVEDSLIHRTAA